MLDRASLTGYSEPSYQVIADRWRDTPLSAIGAFERGGNHLREFAPLTAGNLHQIERVSRLAGEAHFNRRRWSSDDVRRLLGAFFQLPGENDAVGMRRSQLRDDKLLPSCDS